MRWLVLHVETLRDSKRKPAHYRNGGVKSIGIVAPLTGFNTRLNCK